MTLSAGPRAQPVKPASIPAVESTARTVAIPSRQPNPLETAPAWQELVAVESEL